MDSKRPLSRPLWRDISVTYKYHVISNRVNQNIIRLITVIISLVIPSRLTPCFLEVSSILILLMLASLTAHWQIKIGTKSDLQHHYLLFCVTYLSKMKSCAKRDLKSEDVNVKLIKPLQIVQSNDLTIECNMTNTFLKLLWMLG